MPEGTGSGPKKAPAKKQTPQQQALGADSVLVENTKTKKRMVYSKRMAGSLPPHFKRV